MTTQLITADEIRAHRDKYECGIYDAKEAVARQKLDQLLDKVAARGIGGSIASQEFVDAFRLLRMELGRNG